MSAGGAFEKASAALAVAILAFDGGLGYMVIGAIHKAIAPNSIEH